MDSDMLNIWMGRRKNSPGLLKKAEKQRSELTVYLLPMYTLYDVNNSVGLTGVFIFLLATMESPVFLHLRWRVSNSLTPCSMMEREESSQPTLSLAFCSRLLGLSREFFASGVAGGDIARLISSSDGP